MNIARQLGQSMTEYIVVLGVTGLSLLAATTEVGELFDNVHRSYATQSNEMNQVQLYKNQKVRFNENPPGDGDFDDGDTLPPHDGDLPDADEQLPSIEWVYDSDGTQLGQMSGDTLLDDEGNIIAWCERTVTGDCVFQDADGNIIFIGATSSRQWVDENGNELPLLALTSSGRVYGFAYEYKGQLYSSRDRKLLKPQPTGFSTEPMRRIQSFDSQGVPQTEGYELGGTLYSYQSTLAELDTSRPVPWETNKELVTILNPPASPQWQGYAPCLVMPSGWLPSPIGPDDLPDNQLSGVWESKFNDPSIRIGNDSIGGFIDSNAADCQGRSSVTYNSDTGVWTLVP